MTVLENYTFEYEETKPVTIESLIPEKNRFDFVCATVNGRLRELTFKIKGPVSIRLLPIRNNTEAQNIYKNSLTYVLAKVLHETFPDIPMKFVNDVSRSVYIFPTDEKVMLDQTQIRKIYLAMKEVISEDLPIERLTLSKKEAAELYKKQGFVDKLDILRYRKEEDVHLYRCGDYVDYFYSKMVPSTGYLTKFNLLGRAPGFLLQFPRADFEGEIPPFVPEPVYQETLERARRQASRVGFDTIARVNDLVERYGSNDFIELCESMISNQLADLGARIAHAESPIKLICIAGPSSSSKTTFANRLRLELMSLGLSPIRISGDDYYKEKKDLVPLPDGSYDLESIDALDVDLFNNQMLALSQGKEVCIPHYNFQTGHREEGRKLKLDPNGLLIVEGIHALNERMTSNIPTRNKFKIFIAPQAQISIDNHSPISITDLRLIRRIVRDYNFRGASAEETISMWPSVRRGEFNWIYATQEEADYVFNSFMPYECSVMKKYALPLLEKISKNSEAFLTCRSLLQFLKYFTDIDERDIPCNSLIREFIGGSCFKDV